MEIRETYSLQPQLQAGGTRIAALIRQKIQCFHGNTGLGAVGKKQPVAIIIAVNSGYKIFKFDEQQEPPIKEDQKIRAAIREFAETGLSPE